jgi:hypothetical protein
MSTAFRFWQSSTFIRHTKADRILVLRNMHEIKEFYFAALIVKIKIPQVRLFQFQNKVHCTYTKHIGKFYVKFGWKSDIGPLLSSKVALHLRIPVRQQHHVY